MYHDLIALRRNLAGKTGGLTGHELHRTVELDFLQTLAHRLFEAGPGVVLGEVVEDPDKQRRGGHGEARR